MNEQQRDEQPASLIDRAVRRLSPASPATLVTPARPSWPPRSSMPRPIIDWRIAAALAALIALGPLLTIVGAGMLEREADRAAAQRLASAAPRIAAAAADRNARDVLRTAVREAPVAVWLDRAAAALPADARLTRMRHPADGQYEFDVIAPDPDLVRSALRRDPAFAGFRESGQRRAGAMILITYRRAR